MARGGKGKGPGAWQTSGAYRIAIAVIANARDASGLTQRQLAERLKKPPSWIGKIETHERRMDVVEFIAIARALGVQEIELLKAVLRELPRRLDI